MGPITLGELAIAAREICRTTTGNPYFVAWELCYCFEHIRPSDDPVDVVRELIMGILDELHVQWDRKEDAPDWPDDDDE